MLFQIFIHQLIIGKLQSEIKSKLFLEKKSIIFKLINQLLKIHCNDKIQ